MCIIAAPEGVKKMQEDHPDVVYIGALDDHLNEHGILFRLGMPETVFLEPNSMKIIDSIFLYGCLCLRRHKAVLSQNQINLRFLMQENVCRMEINMSGKKERLYQLG